MTNKQYLVITDIYNTLKAITSIAFVGEFPDDLSKIGQRFPAVILEDGDETFGLFSGNQYKSSFEVRVHTYIHIVQNQTKMKSLLDLQATINHAILADLTLGGTCKNVTLTKVDKYETENEAGQQIAHRVIKYQIEIHDTRV